MTYLFRSSKTGFSKGTFWAAVVSREMRTLAYVVALNLALFVLITSLPAFQAVHHHWIFPVLGLIFSLQWALAGGFVGSGEPGGFVSPHTARQALLFLLAVLLLAGVARHETVLTCFARCGYKLGATALWAGFIFYRQASLRDPGPWNMVRSQAAALGAAVWGFYLLLRAFGFAPWVLDLGLAGAALMFWLARNPQLIARTETEKTGFFTNKKEQAVAGTTDKLFCEGKSPGCSVESRDAIGDFGLGRRGRARLTLALAVPVFIAIRNTGREGVIIGAGAALALFLFWLVGRQSGPVFLTNDPGGRPSLWGRAVRTVLLTALALGILFKAMGPFKTVMNPGDRRRALLAAASRRRPPDPSSLSPLARRLQAHVQFLAGEIGERPLYEREALARARDYVASAFREAGLRPSLLNYAPAPPVVTVRGTTFDNVEAVLGSPRSGGEGIWVVGAHYDTAPGTPGADDNASGVAVLLELARLLKDARLGREVRLVAFSTEEPPSFGTRTMGSFHYARRLREANVPVEGMWALEMLGYYNDAPGSQFYPPFLHLLFPDRGDFIGAVSNFSSRRLLGRFNRSWRERSDFPLTAAVLPSVLATAALSDQLNFWAEGFPALMISDTAFYRNPHYHEASDLPGSLDYEKMARVTEALAGVLADLCGKTKS